MVINILIFLLIIILILIIVNIILISVQPKNIYGGAGPDGEDMVASEGIKFQMIFKFLTKIKEVLDRKKLSNNENLNNDINSLSKINNMINAKEEQIIYEHNQRNSYDATEIEYPDELPNAEIEVKDHTMEGKTYTVYANLEIDTMDTMRSVPISKEQIIEKYHFLNLPHYNFVKILTSIMNILYDKSQKKTLLECAAGNGIISAFIAYTQPDNTDIEIIATDPKPIEPTLYNYYPIERKTLLKSIEDHPSQMILISRGYNTFMNGKFVKSWIEKNVGKVIVLVIIDNRLDTSKESFYQILSSNGFTGYSLGNSNLLFKYDDISDNDDVTIYVKNVENANYVADTDEDLTITDDDRYAYTNKNGDIFSCRQTEITTIQEYLSSNIYPSSSTLSHQQTKSALSRENFSHLDIPSSDTYIYPTPSTYYKDSKSTKRNKNRDNCRVGCSIMG